MTDRLTDDVLNMFQSTICSPNFKKIHPNVLSVFSANKQTNQAYSTYKHSRTFCVGAMLS